MRSSTLALAAVLVASAPARANDLHGYYDLIVPDIVGELGTRGYDVTLRQDGGDGRALGTTGLRGGHYAGGGFGLRVLAAWPAGFLLGGEAQVSGGQIRGAESPWRDLSGALHYTAVAQVGAHLSLEVVMLHAAAVFGLDGMRLDADGVRDGGAAGAAWSSGGAAAGVRLSRIDLRAGLQLGVHVNIARLFALFVDGTVDYDGQYRVRCGVAFGAARNERW